jgi:glycyl-tRNA synthetase
MQKSSLQEIILNLQSFWAAQGCLIAQPYYTQVGAGTMNPATFLRVLGPEPWNAAYVEPSVRPDDGRYGENPNRFQQHTQFQVILKPDPGNPQELYLESLKALGIDPRRHDIRFVEDNWEQPAISAWGLGWEVWLDGQEITQFTYFQQMGGVSLDPVSVELTYGLERILIALNNAAAIWDEPWGANVTYGEVRRQEEYEHSQYYFETANVERLRAMYDLFAAEAQTCLEQGLVVPAHDYLLKCSHAFNVLDTRGAVSAAERQGYFRGMRLLARGVAEAYSEQRRGLEYPLLKETGPQVAAAQTAGEEVQLAAGPAGGKAADFLLEIGVEEMPAGDVDSAREQLAARVPALLAELGLTHGEVRTFATPRRLVAYVEALSPHQPDREDLVKGPPADKAYDKDGTALPAALGFARKNSLQVEDLSVREENGGKYVFAVVRQQGRPAGEVLAEGLPKLVEGLKFEKSMRWNASGVSFSRPIRWLVALFGGHVVPFAYAGVTSGRLSRGLRPYDSPEIEIASAAKYFEAVRKAGILLDKEERRTSIAGQVEQAAAQAGGQAVLDEDLLAEVANLVEKPTAVLGAFAEAFLSLPRDVLISVMKKHQRYFPVQKNGRLLPYFVAVRNGDDQHLEVVRQGNEHVLNARFADADFFVREDLKQPLEAFRPNLAGLTFHAKLGSMLDKSGRVEALVDQLVPALGLEKDQAVFARRAARLAKADLVTRMVTEMTSLQGLVGREYALRGGEHEQVAAAIGELYQPMPRSLPGLAVALADRLDSLVGLFAAGLAPTGAKDPFGLRRAAIGIAQPLVEHGLDFDLAAAVRKAAALQPIQVGDEVRKEILEFLAGRLNVALKEAGFRYDVVEAVLAEQSANPAAAARGVRQLQAWVERPDWQTILPAYARCARILRSASVSLDQLPGVNEKLLADAEEKALYAQVRASLQQPPSSVDQVLERVTKLVPVINAFFDQVLVMAEDEELRLNRLALVGQIAGLPAGLADLSRLEGF